MRHMDGFMLKNKKIVLGVTGGIAAYKAAELTRLFIRQGAQIRVILTENATAFITPLTLQTLSQGPVYVNAYAPTDQYDMAHISLAQWADAFVIAPATANIIGKIASGIADDLLSTTIMAQDRPTLICPAMNDKMLANPILQDNIGKLKKFGYRVMESATGELACKTAGSGRLPEPQDIVEEIEYLLAPKDFQNLNILITAGPTQEPFDPVRFISNGSSGKMGYALARAAARRAASVTLVSGPTALTSPGGVHFVQVRTAEEMRAAVLENASGQSVIIKAAAVSDYRPKYVKTDKIKKEKTEYCLDLEPNPDILAELGSIKKRCILVGFAMETRNLLDNATTKLREKNLDMIVANNLNEEGAGFQSETNIITLIDKSGNIITLPKMTKLEAADQILDHIQTFLPGKSKTVKK